MATESWTDCTYLPRHLWGSAWDDENQRQQRIAAGVQDPSCPSCGHIHAGPELANTCVGCPCDETPGERHHHWLAVHRHDGHHRPRSRFTLGWHTHFHWWHAHG